MTREDWLEIQLENSELTDVKRVQYTNELEQMAQRLEQQQYAKQLEVKQFEDIRVRLLAGEDVVDTVGEKECGDDYILKQIEDGWVVESKVAMIHQDTEHKVTSLGRAKAKRRHLIMYRLYNKYVRSGDFESVGSILQLQVA